MIELVNDGAQILVHVCLTPAQFLFQTVMHPAHVVLIYVLPLLGLLVLLKAGV